MVKRQENILHIYINQIHPERQYENDVIWMNKYNKNKNGKLEKKHKENFQNLITEQKLIKKKRIKRLKSTQQM